MNVSLRSAGKVPGVKRKGYLNVEARVPAGAKAGPAHEGGYFEWNHLCSGERDSEESREKIVSDFQFLLACVSPSFSGKQPLLCLQDYDYVESKRLHPSRPFNLPDPESLAMNFRIILFFILKKEGKKVEKGKRSEY